MSDSASSPDKRFAPVKNSRTFNRILDTLGLHSKKVLDMGCGYGEYLVCFGPGSVGITTTLHEVEYGKEHGLSIVRGNVELLDEMDLKDRFDAAWANNLFEHLVGPHAFLITLKTVMRDDAVLVLGVPVVPRIASLMRLTKFRGALAAAHVNFFTRETLRLAVERAGWKVDTVRPFYFSNTFLDFLGSFFAPHLYVVARNGASFRYLEKKLNEWKDEPLYEKIVAVGTGKKDNN